MRTARTLLLLLIAAAVLTVGVLGCEGPLGPRPPEVPAGRIEGRVRTGGMPMDSRVIARRMLDDGEGAFSTKPDSTGAYLLDLPAGRYVVSLEAGSSRYIYDYARTGLSTGDTPPDTLRVGPDHSHRGIDFELSALEIEVRLSDRLDGEYGEVFLSNPSLGSTWERSYVSEGSAPIEAGRFTVRLPGILPGEYRILLILGHRDYMCYCPWGGERVWYPGTRDPEASPWIRFDADEVVQLHSELPTETARIEGIVGGAWVEVDGAEQPDIGIVTADSLSVLSPRRVAEDGTFGIDLHLPGPVKVYVRQNDLIQWIGGDGFEEATVFDLVTGETITGLTHARGALRFAVTGWSPFSDQLRLDFHDADDPTGPFLTASLENGLAPSLAVCNIPPGRYLLHVVWDGAMAASSHWIPQWFDRARTPEEARIVEVTLDAVETLDIVLEPGGSVSGRLLLDEQEEQNYFLFLTPADEAVTIKRDFTGWGSDQFYLAGLLDGDYKLGVVSTRVEGWSGEPHPEATIWYPGVESWEDAALLEIRDLGAITDLVLQIP